VGGFLLGRLLGQGDNSFDKITGKRCSAGRPALVAQKAVDAFRHGTLLPTLAEEGMTMVIVTHEIGFARDVGTRLLFIDKGHILHDGILRNCYPIHRASDWIGGR
jgi:ABC-type histidine transport system ATPase subunit